jgi:transcriptional regulator with XRE-family HTH domain
MATDSDQARRFGERLRAAMTAKGLTGRGRSGVDVNALAKGAQVSYEMARRYAEGIALPRPDVIEAIAEWLGVDSAMLAWGAVAPGNVDVVVLEQCLQAVRAAEAASGISLDPDHAARIVAQLYEETRRGEVPSASTLTALLKAMRPPT